MPDQVYRITTKFRAAQCGDRFGVHALVGEIRAGRHANLGKLNAEAGLPDHRAGQLFAGHDALVDVLMKRMGIGLGTELIGEDFTGRHTALQELKGRIDLRNTFRSF